MTNNEHDEHVDWDLARRVAVRIAGAEPLYRSYLAAPLHEDFARFVPVAAELVAIETGLDSPGEPHAEVIDRQDWIDVNLAAFRRLLQPLLGAADSGRPGNAGEPGEPGKPGEPGRLGNTGELGEPGNSGKHGGTGEPSDTSDSGGSGNSGELGTPADGLRARVPMAASRVARTLGAVELGSVLGWMSRRVLGQYDLLWAFDDEPGAAESSLDAASGAAPTAATGAAPTTVAAPAAAPVAAAGDTVYFVGPNILLTEKRYAFIPAQFRLWLALHELTHRSQFMGVGWLRPHFMKLVNALIDNAHPDSARLLEGLKALAARRANGRDLLGEGGLAAVFATEEQRGLLSSVGGMMSLVEGHGDVTMSRAARGHIPDAERFALVMHHRRRSARGAARLIQRLVGIEAKIAQYQAGEEFISAIEAERGPRAVDRIWERPEHLPSMAEIRDPAAWMERVPAV